MAGSRSAVRIVLYIVVAIVVAGAGWGAWIMSGPDPLERLPQWIQTRPSVYLRIAIKTIRAHALQRQPVDWPAIEAHAQELASEARSADGTYPAIRYVLDQIGGLSVLVPAPPALVDAKTAEAPRGSYGLQVLFPDRVVALVYPGSPAAAAGVKPGDRVELIEEHPPMVSHDPLARGNFIEIRPPQATLRLRSPDGSARDVTLTVGQVQLFPAETHRIAEDLGYVSIPSTSGSGDFAARVRDGITGADAATVCGWVVDLRRDTGGDVRPMLQAVRPILGEPPIGAYVDGSGAKTPWEYPASGPFAIAAPMKPLLRARPPVAVLTSRLTAGSGEILVVAFRGRVATRTFGEPTWGLPVDAARYPLPDGASLQLATRLAADRLGRIYESRIEPDEKMPVDWAQVGSPVDPDVVAAATWLRAQPGCKK